MTINIKTIINGLILDICVINCFDKSDIEPHLTEMEKELLEFKKKNGEYYKKLMVFIKRVSDVGIEHYIANHEKLKPMEKYRDFEILAIKIHGLRMFSIVIKNNKLVLLEFCKKKQNEYNKANDESLKRAKKKIDLLFNGGVL
jgi:hypothetical protein